VYNYASVSRVVANNDEGETKAVVTTVNAKLHFECLSESDAGFTFRMKPSNFFMEVTSDGVSEEDPLTGDEADQAYGLPVTFLLSHDGVISEVVADAEEEEETVSMKVAMIENIKTVADNTPSRLEATNLGQHFVHYDMMPTESGVEVVSSFTTQDVLFLRDEDTPADVVTINGNSFQTVSEGIMKSNTQYLFTMLTPQVDSNTEADENLLMYSDGQTSFELLEAIPSEESFDHLTRDVASVDFLSHSFYIDRVFTTTEVEEENIVGASATCPGGLTSCVNPGLNWWIGNSNCGLNLVASVAAGTNKGCKQETRDFLVGAYLNFDLYILGHKISGVDAYAEYGYIGGGAQRNCIHCSVFGAQIYHRAFPDLPCVEKTANLVNISKTASVGFKWWVFVLHVSFSVGVTLSFKTDWSYKICMTTGEASISLLPTAGARFFADAHASAVVAKAGVRLEASVTAGVDPTAYLSLGLCRVGVRSYCSVTPFGAKFYGYWQTRTIHHFKIKWSSKHTHTWWEWSKPIERKLLFDKYIQLWK